MSKVKGGNEAVATIQGRADAETARPTTPASGAPACRWCHKPNLPVRRPAEQVRPLLEGGGAPLHGCDPCLSMVERGLTARCLELLAVPSCRPWCVKHATDPGGHTCVAPTEHAPTETGQDPGRVILWHDTQLGHVFNLACKVEDLTIEEAEQLLRALRTQVTRARRASR